MFLNPLKCLRLGKLIGLTQLLTKLKVCGKIIKIIKFDWVKFCK